MTAIIAALLLGAACALLVLGFALFCDAIEDLSKLAARRDEAIAYLETIADHAPARVADVSPGSAARPPASADPGHLHVEVES